MNDKTTGNNLPGFDRGTWESGAIASKIGSGQVGGKVAGLLAMDQAVLAELDISEFEDMEVTVPRMIVLGTDFFDAFMQLNNLWELALSGVADNRIAFAFQRATLPPEYLGDLRDFISQVNAPLAVRSSSLLEDALEHPFAGVYETKMIPNNQPDTDTRFTRLTDAIRFVFASTFFKTASDYFLGVGQDHTREKMAVLIQEVVGTRHDDIFYPTVSGVARSFSYYPSGAARPTDGVVNLALGLGKQIVDGGLSWTYSPAYPKAPPPFNNVGDRIKNSQNTFWGVNMGTPPPPDPMTESEFLVKGELPDAKKHGVLDHIVSTYDGRSDRLRLGANWNGPHVLDFGPILVGETKPVNSLVTRILALAERATGCPVEIEFALQLAASPEEKDTFCLLQMRPMVIPEGTTPLAPQELKKPGVVISSEHALGHGIREDIQDIVFLKPGAFAAKYTQRIAMEIDQINKSLLTAKRPYILIGFGRWGSSDPWLGVPITWGQISGARVIVETSFRDMNPDPSQGAHFFHNLISVGVFYMTLREHGGGHIDWDWLENQTTVQELEFVKHVAMDKSLLTWVDGLAGLGLVKEGGQ
jgi:hypothetical protein